MTPPPLFGRKHRRGESEATQARKAAEVEYERVKAETPVYAALGKRLRELREQNHFRASFEATFRGSRP